MSDYPEHAKLKALDGKNEAVGDFINWLAEQGYEICQHLPAHGLWPVAKSTGQWIADHFEIDRNKLESEKRQMFDKLREMNEP